MTQAELLPALQFTPPVISLNFDELTARIETITNMYTGLVVKEDDVAAIKSEMAGLNKLAGQLADARKDAVSRVSGPIKDFEAKVKGLEALICNTRTFLDEQVKEHIKRERDARRASVQFIIDFQRNEHDCQDLEIPIQESWLNKTATAQTITNQVQGIVLAHKKQQEEALRLEQAKKDRVVALESHCKAMEQGRGYSLSFSRFAHLQGLEIPLADALTKVSAIYADEDARRAETERAKFPPPSPRSEPHFMDAPEAPVAPLKAKPAQKAMTITGTYSAQNGQAIQALYAQMKTLCLTCAVQVREI